jgi:hypothetical protein
MAKATKRFNSSHENSNRAADDPDRPPTFPALKSPTFPFLKLPPDFVRELRKKPPTEEEIKAAAARAEVREAMRQSWLWQMYGIRLRKRKKTGFKSSGRPRDFNIPLIRETAENYIADNGLPRTIGGDGGLIEKVQNILGDKNVPGKSDAYKIIGPIWRRAEAKLKRG